MSEALAVQPVITIDEMNGRIDEIEAQRNGALARCAKLAGEKALALRLLGEAKAEIERLNTLLAEKADGSASDGDETETAH